MLAVAREGPQNQGNFPEPKLQSPRIPQAASRERSKCRRACSILELTKRLQNLSSAPGGPWAPFPRIALLAWLLFFGFFLYELARGRGILLLMDNVFVPIQEAGHLLFGYFGLTVGVAGGTILRLFVPFALGVYFFWERQAQGVAFCLFFFFEQFLPIAKTYMADARAQQLPLLTIGDSQYVIHDWNYLFTKMSVRATTWRLQTGSASSAGSA